MCLETTKIYEPNDISRVAFKIMEIGFATFSGGSIAPQAHLRHEPITPFKRCPIEKNELYGAGKVGWDHRWGNDRLEHYLLGGAIHCYTNLEEAREGIKHLGFAYYGIYAVLGHNIVAEGVDFWDRSNVAFKRVEFISLIEKVTVDLGMVRKLDEE